ncbi:MAG: hypothetical protein OCC49_00415 [Fibrobacterales bacterium]
MIDYAHCTERELWEYVATYLAQNNIRNVLVGGAVAVVYSKGAYRSGDLDIVIENFNLPKGKIAELMGHIGFIKKRTSLDSF